MAKPKFYYNDTWRQGFEFCIGITAEDMNKYLSEKYKAPDNEIPINAAGATSELRNAKTGNSVLVIWLEDGEFNRKNVAALGHEALHAANRVCLNRGYIPDPNNDEAHAYLFTIIFEQALRLMYKPLKRKTP